MKKSVKIGLAAAIALPILAAAAIRLFVDANTFRPMIESRLTAALSRKVTLGDLSLSVMTGSLVANDLAIAEDPKFGQTPFFTAKQLRIGVQMKPLIFNRQLIVRSFEVDAPQIHLIRAEDGTWNFSTLSHGASSQNDADGHFTRSPRRPHHHQRRKRHNREAALAEKSPGLRPSRREVGALLPGRGLSLHG